MTLRKKIILSSVALISTVCIASYFLISSPEGDSVSLEIPLDSIHGYGDNAAPNIGFYVASQSDSVEAVTEKLKKSGFKVEVIDASVTSIAGLHGDTVNLTYSDIKYFEIIRANKTRSRRIDLSRLSNRYYGIINDRDKYDVVMYGFGNKIVAGRVSIIYSDDNKQGPDWSSVKAELNDESRPDNFSRNLPSHVEDVQDYKGYFDSVTGALSSDGAITYSINATPCKIYMSNGSGNSMPPLLVMPGAEPRVPDALIGNRDGVCRIDFNYADKAVDPVASVVKLIKEKHVAEFGEPDCWVDVVECGKKMVDGRPAHSIAAKMVSKVMSAR